MPITFIAFGPGKSYTVVYKNGWHTSAREGSSVLALKQKVKDEGGTIHSFAFGEGGSWFISYDLPDGKSRWRWEGIDVQYPALKKWLDDFSKRSWTAKGLTLALGPDGSYWAWEKSRGFSYCNLDQKLIDRLLEDKDKRYTQNVTLGLDGSFIYWNDRGGSLISIRGYEGAADWLNPRVRSEGGRLKIATASLSAFDDDTYFFLLSDGTAYWRLPSHLTSKAELIRNKYIENLPKAVVGGEKKAKGRTLK